MYSYTVWVYGFYLVVSVAFTMWVAWTLHKNEIGRASCRERV